MQSTLRAVSGLQIAGCRQIGILGCAAVMQEGKFSL